MTVSINTVASGGVVSTTGPAEVLATTYPLPTITSPVEGDIGVSKTPTITTKEGVAAPYILARRDTASQTAVVVDTDLIYNAQSDADVPLNVTTGVFTLRAGVEYELTACPNLTSFDLATSYAYFRWVLDSDNSAIVTGQSGSIIPSTFVGNSGSQPTARATLRPTVDTDVKVRVWAGSGSCNFVTANSWASIRTTALKNLDYTHMASQIQVALSSTGEIVFDSGEVASLSAAVSPALTGTTIYKTRTRHKGDSGYWTDWSGWTSFTTIA